MKISAISHLEVNYLLIEGLPANKVNAGDNKLVVAIIRRKKGGDEDAE